MHQETELWLKVRPLTLSRLLWQLTDHFITSARDSYWGDAEEIWARAKLEWFHIIACPQLTWATPLLSESKQELSVIISERLAWRLFLQCFQSSLHRPHAAKTMATETGLPSYSHQLFSPPLPISSLPQGHQWSRGFPFSLINEL